MTKKCRFSCLSVCIQIVVILGFLSSCDKELKQVELEPSFVQELSLTDEIHDSLMQKCAKNGILTRYELINTLPSETIKALVGPSFEPLIKYGVNMYKVSYRTIYNGRVIIASGIVGIPDMPIDQSTTVVLYNHGTRITEADLLPSSGFDLISVVSAANGKICFAADYIGFGDSKQISHPYLVKSAAIYPVCDMIMAGIEFLKQEFNINGKPSLTIFGFSQGAGITMAVQRELEKNKYYGRKINIKGVAMATGPYDLHDGTIMPVFSQETYSSPSFIVFAFISFNRYYKLGIDLNDIFKNSYADQFLALVAENKTSAEINSVLPVTLSELLQDDFRSDFMAERTPFNFLFKINATYKGWAPKSPTRIYHSPADEIVPYANAQTAYNSFIAAGSGSVNLITLPPVDHVSSAFMAFADIINWIDSN